MPKYVVRKGYVFFLGEGDKTVTKRAGEIIEVTADKIRGQDWKVEEVKETAPAPKPEPTPAPAKAVDAPPVDKAVKTPPANKSISNSAAKKSGKK